MIEVAGKNEDFLEEVLERIKNKSKTIGEYLH